MMRCRRHKTDFETAEDLLLHVLEHQLIQEDLMTSFSNDQAHLDSDVAKLAEAFNAAVTELKAAIQNNPNQPASQIDFTKLDSLVGTVQAEAASDAAPSIPAVPGSTVAAPTSNDAALTGAGNDVTSSTDATVTEPPAPTEAPA